MELLNEFLEQGDIHIGQGLLDRKRHRGIIDILRGEAEMDEFLEAR